ncbi:PREDICTED: phosphatidylserine decarboxylase proenzyme 1, mitochondrial isoform X3 [Tarenaya hassleriana]|uniref:phosphatidylserine decarboxylase proenzyme 1, mitochondrial isoform X3 n=1 Tax=Tarenaya hassleriana TaxID=28532 RepID=UPI00053C8238|nr:PREDICTED: phosphatidylserine decarboxylase proenzyme 1, mitochondrial isoform X3 [Tarenaya hassleriana]
MSLCSLTVRVSSIPVLIDEPLPPSLRTSIPTPNFALLPSPEAAGKTAVVVLRGMHFFCPEQLWPPSLCWGLSMPVAYTRTRRLKRNEEKELNLSSNQTLKPHSSGSYLCEPSQECGAPLQECRSSQEIPVWMRPYVYKAWARAFHSNLDEVALPLEEYPSLWDFFIRSLKGGCRPIDQDPHCLISPVDGTILRFGELKGDGAMIEQVKGHSYSLTALLGASSLLPLASECRDERQEGTVGEKSDKSWWRISLASPKLQETISVRPMSGLYYCVIYLRPGDYHRIHSPADWKAMVRRHFAGRLFPVNERATRTIRNLYVENERVVLEGLWQEGYMALAAIGATNIGSIEIFIERELRTNEPRKKLFPAEPPEERVYNPERGGIVLKRGEEVGGFGMGSTVVVVFQASSQFGFCVGRGDRVRVGQPLGRHGSD